VDKINFISQTTSLTLVITISLIFTLLGLVYSKKHQGLNNYLTANRNVGFFSLSTSLVASALGAWILFGPASAATWGGIGAVIGYALGTAFPMIFLIYLGKKIRSDIIEAVNASNTEDDFLMLYKKCFIFNKNISKDICKNIIGTYKRASNIIDQELKNQKENIMGQPESFLFKKDEEKHLFNKINEIRKYFSSTKRKESYDVTLKVLAEAKLTTDNFFDNVIVNDENSDIKKNRLELLQMFCKTYNNFIDFSKVEGA